jgi:diguanylate cyclase (GGDEF)-like protein
VEEAVNAEDRAPLGPGREPVTVDDDQTLADRDQTAADGDQTGSDFDQTAADADQTASERDQLASDRDQKAADRDQVTSDAARGNNVDALDYASTRRDRVQSTLERDLTSHTRSETARVRDETAAGRDRLAAERDEAAHARDELSATLDAEIERLERHGGSENGRPPIGVDVLLRAADDRNRAAASRARAAAQRDAAARDRELAAQDRRRAALDRRAAAEELALEGVDHLTGVLRRRVGLDAIQREMDRTQRRGERLVIAFVDVDGLKRLNDTNGHQAGDELLRVVARSISQHLRSYDVIARYGGDEFVCSLAGQDAPGARERFGEIRARLTAAANGATISVGLAERRDDESLDELIRRADAAMIEARRKTK